ncbi:hypothetical protein ACU4GR_12315 [Methylobacterium oryzae CBMB20]
MAEPKPFHPDVNDVRKFNEAQHQVHSLLQWVARVENSYGPDAGTRGPVRLRWCDERRAIKTHGLADGLELELRVAEMVLQFLEDGRPSRSRVLGGRTLTGACRGMAADRIAAQRGGPIEVHEEPPL